MSASQRSPLPVPDPPGTVWTLVGVGAGIVDRYGNRETVLLAWADLTTLAATPGIASGYSYLHYRVETLDGLLLTHAVSEDRQTVVTQYGLNPEAVRVDRELIPPYSEVLAWAGACHAHGDGVDRREVWP